MNQGTPDIFTLSPLARTAIRSDEKNNHGLLDFPQLLFQIISLDSSFHVQHSTGNLSSALLNLISSQFNFPHIKRSQSFLNTSKLFNYFEFTAVIYYGNCRGYGTRNPRNFRRMARNKHPWYSATFKNDNYFERIKFINIQWSDSLNYIKIEMFLFYLFKTCISWDCWLLIFPGAFERCPSKCLYCMESKIQLLLKRFPNSSIFPNLQHVDARKNIWSPKICSNTHG